MPLTLANSFQGDGCYPACVGITTSARSLSTTTAFYFVHQHQIQNTHHNTHQTIQVSKLIGTRSIPVVLPRSFLSAELRLRGCSPSRLLCRTTANHSQPL